MSEELKNLSVINFTNIDTQDFEGLWGGETTIIKAGETRQFPKFLAEHYCKHLVNKILIKEQKDWSNQLLREPLEKKILGIVEAEIEKPIQSDVIEQKPVQPFAEAPKVEPNPAMMQPNEPKSEPKKKQKK